MRCDVGPEMGRILQRRVDKTCQQHVCGLYLRRLIFMLFPFRSYDNRRRFSLSSLAFAGMVISLLLLSACGGSSGGSTSPTTKATVKAPNDLIKPGVLLVGSDTTYAPQEFIDTTSGNPTGFDVDLIKAMAQKMGLTADVETT